MGFQIAELKLASGHIGICQMPGRKGEFAGDLAAVLAWRPDTVLTMTTEAELRGKGAGACRSTFRRQAFAGCTYPLQILACRGQR